MRSDTPTGDAASAAHAALLEAIERQEAKLIALEAEVADARSTLAELEDRLAGLQPASDSPAADM